MGLNRISTESKVSFCGNIHKQSRMREKGSCSYLNTASRVSGNHLCACDLSG